MPDLISSHVATLDGRNRGAPWAGPTCPTYPTIKEGGNTSPLWGPPGAPPDTLPTISPNWLDWLGRLDNARNVNELPRPTWSAVRGRLARRYDHGCAHRRIGEPPALGGSLCRTLPGGTPRIP
jgi:hypothetical protein